MNRHNRDFNNTLKLYLKIACSFSTLYMIKTDQAVKSGGPQLSLEKYRCVRMLIYITMAYV